MKRFLLAATLVVGCGDATSTTSPEASPPEATPPGASSAGSAEHTTPPGSSSAGGPTDATPPVALPTTPGIYRQACDGSGAIALDADHFINANDESQVLRIYRRGADAAPVQSIEVGSMIGVEKADEADIEDLVRVDNRVYGITSHGRSKYGELRTERYRFFGLDVSGSVPNVSITSAGNSENLLSDMLVSANWTTPDETVIAALRKASQLTKGTDAKLAPEAGGTNIEGLAALPKSKKLIIGFRNPTVDGSALFVTLLNADEVLRGQTARFGEAQKFDLGGLGVRSMAWSRLHDALLILAGSKSSGTTFRLFKWSGDSKDAPAPVQDITPPKSGSAEAIVVYENTKDMQIIFDEGDKDVAGDECKAAPEASRSFTDTIVHVE